MKQTQICSCCVEAPQGIYRDTYEQTKRDELTY